MKMQYPCEKNRNYTTKMKIFIQNMDLPDGLNFMSTGFFRDMFLSCSDICMLMWLNLRL